ncbi:MAG: peptidase M15, partial [Cellulomonadaceae bacterium]|nr:peptidase M15 [Cellulomonadaceae bacterium]
PSEAPAGSSAARRAAASAAAPRWIPRVAVLGALSAATIVVPLMASGSTIDAATAATVAAAVGDYPSAYEVLSADSIETTPTSLLAAASGASRTSETVSRSLVRDPLPGCDGEAHESGSNGLIPDSDLCDLSWAAGQSLRGDAAVALTELDDFFSAAFGRDLCITDSYRSLADQRRVAYTKPGLAATPGTSNHGWGLAIDLCSSETNSSAAITWLKTNGPTYGWVNPDWAGVNGSGAYEPWHWEYLPGTTELGTNY